MPKIYSVKISELEDKILKWAEYDPHKWFEAIIKNRASAAIDELYEIELKKAVEAKKTISSNKKDVVLKSNELSAKEKTEKLRVEALELMKEQKND